MVTFHRSMGWDFLFCFYHLDQHLNVIFRSRKQRVIISMTDFFFFFLFLQVLNGDLRTPKCCCYIFFPNQKAKCYHSNMTMLEMSICIAHIKVEFSYFLPRVGDVGEQPC